MQRNFFILFVLIFAVALFFLFRSRRSILQRQQAFQVTHNGHGAPIHYNLPERRIAVAPAAPVAPVSGVFKLRPVGNEKIESLERVREATRVRGASYSFNGKHYSALPQLKALPERLFSPGEGKVVETKAGDVIFSPKSGVSVPSESLPVVYDDASRQIAILTGALNVKWRDESAKDGLARDYEMQIIQSFDPINVTYFQSSAHEVSSLMDLYQRLKKDQRVVDVTLHVIDREFIPQ